MANILRLALCPHEPVDCDRYCSGRQAHRECDAVAGVLDRDTFNQLLVPGERSAIFTSRSSIVKERYGIHATNFFYIKIDDEEIARVEVPLWAAQSKELIQLVHTLIWQRRGLATLCGLLVKVYDTISSLVDW